MMALALGALAIGFAPVFAAIALKPEYGGFGPASIGFYRVFKCAAANVGAGRT